MQYDALAPIYDRLMSHVEYEEWAELITKIVLKFSKTPDPHIIEIGAGTGILGGRLKNLGYDYIASDISFSMCREARGKTECAIPVCAADGRNLPFKKQFDLALFLYDGINYLQTLHHYSDLFNSVYNVLVPGGLFLFDITTRANSMKYFSDNMYYEDFDEFSYIRHSHFDEKDAVQHNDFTIYRKYDDNSNLYEKITEKHQQKVFTPAQIKTVIDNRQFKVTGVWNGYTFRKYSNKSERIHFLLQRLA
ncbi:MAG: class I SAM-dependent methyltransferase [Chitinispirillia bacterium]|nr:class I SAM-dependent methyltransferase [Chitinispirillia bacterium]